MILLCTMSLFDYSSWVQGNVNGAWRYWAKTSAVDLCATSPFGDYWWQHRGIIYCMGLLDGCVGFCFFSFASFLASCL